MKDEIKTNYYHPKPDNVNTLFFFINIYFKVLCMHIFVCFVLIYYTLILRKKQKIPQNESEAGNIYINKLLKISFFLKP